MKIKALILALIMILSSLPASVFAISEVETDVYESTLDFLMALDVIENVPDKNAIPTRAAFLNLVMTALRYDLPTAYDGSFTDVSENHEYASAVYQAKMMGIVSGSGGQRFYPDEPITYNAAIKILVCALGYQNIAELSGVYPTGYLRIAKDIHLTNYVANTGENALTMEHAVVLIFNFMHADLFNLISTDGTNVIQKSENGVNILTEKYNLVRTYGVIKSAGHVSMKENFSGKKAVIDVDGVTYETSLTDCEKYLGLKAYVYYNEDTNIACAVYVDRKNVVYECSAEDVVGFNNFVLKLEDDSGKKEELHFNRGYTFVQNGRVIANTDEDFKPIHNNAFFKYIDNDDDGYIDVVIAEKYEYMRITSKNAVTNSVYDSRSGKNYTMTREDGYWYHLQVRDEEGNLTDASFEQLNNDMILTVYQSEDGKYIKAVASDKTVSGTIEEVGEDYILIDETAYETNHYFDALKIAQTAVKGTFYLADDGTITSFEEGAGKFKYAYLVDYSVGEEKLTGSTRKVKLRDERGDLLTLGFAEKVWVDGERVARQDSKLSNALSNGTYPKYQLLRYSVNADGEIDAIDTAVLAPAAMDIAALQNEFNTLDTDNDSLIQNIDRKYSRLHAGYGLLIPFAKIGAGTIFFKVPSELKNDENRNAKYDEKYFKKISMGDLEYSQSYIVDIYGQNSNFEPKVVVVYDSSATGNPEVPVSTPPVLVERVTTAVNQEGDVTKKLQVLDSGTFKSYVLATDLLSAIGESGVPKSGNLIRMSTNSDGEITALSIDAAMSDGNLTLQQIKNQSHLGYGYYYGTVFSNSSDGMVLKLDSTATSPTLYSEKDSDTGTTHSIDDEMAVFYVGSNTFYAQANTATGYVKQLRKEDLKSILAVGEENASKVVVYSNAHHLGLVLEYVSE